MTTSRTDELIEAIRALPDEERRRLLRQVAGGRAEPGPASEPAPAAIIGLFADEPELMAEVAEDAMTARERDPLRSRGE